MIWNFEASSINSSYWPVRAIAACSILCPWNTQFVSKWATHTNLHTFKLSIKLVSSLALFADFPATSKKLSEPCPFVINVTIFDAMISSLSNTDLSTFFIRAELKSTYTTCTHTLNISSFTICWQQLTFVLFIQVIPWITFFTYLFTSLEPNRWPCSSRINPIVFITMILGWSYNP